MRLINQKISRPTHVALAALPFVLAIIAYMVARDLRLQVNPADKLLPSFTSMADAFWRMAAEPDRRSGDILLWGDTWASLARLGIGVGISTLLAILLGIPIGLIPVARSTLWVWATTRMRSPS